MINFSSYHIIRFTPNNHFHFVFSFDVRPNFVTEFISHDKHTYIIRPPTGSMENTVSKIIRKKCI